MSQNGALENWIASLLGGRSFRCVPLSNDASFRNYFRIMVEGETYIAMNAPPPENPSTFVAIGQRLATQGLTVPAVIQSYVEQGFLLLTDFGDNLYQYALNEHSAPGLYGDAIAALIQIQQCSTEEIPCFEPHFLERQLGIFQEWYLKRHLQWTITPDIQLTLQQLLAIFQSVMEAQPQVFVHRDYHSRNLMVLKAGNPGILDFQDAMLGPMTYDLVSLFQDCYISWPRNSVEQWVAVFQDAARATGLLGGDVSRQVFLRWFDLTGLQRHLKNLGIFARLYYRDGKNQYLKDIPQVLQYIRETLERYPELAGFRNFLQHLL